MRTIMVVEDERTLREGLQEQIQHAGYRVVAAAGGQEALDLLRDGEQPALIVMDLMMPEVTGADLVEEMRQDPRLSAIPVIMISAMGGMLKPMDGVVAIFGKPWNEAKLLATIAKHVG